MKKILLLLFLSFFINLYVQAEDIKDFQIGGISLNDSLLNTFTEKEIKKAKRKTSFKSKKYSMYAFFGDYNPYDQLVIYTERKDKSYIIKSVAGFMKFEKNWEGCLKEQDSISDEVQNLFSNAKKTVKEFAHPFDKTGNSIERDVIFALETGEEIGSACQKWGKKYKAQRKKKDTIQVFMDTKEYAAWLRSQGH